MTNMEIIKFTTCKV